MESIVNLMKVLWTKVMKGLLNVINMLCFIGVTLTMRYQFATMC